MSALNQLFKGSSNVLKLLVLISSCVLRQSTYGGRDFVAAHVDLPLPQRVDARWAPRQKISGQTHAAPALNERVSSPEVFVSSVSEGAATIIFAKRPTTTTRLKAIFRIFERR